MLWLLLACNMEKASPTFGDGGATYGGGGGGGDDSGAQDSGDSGDSGGGGEEGAPELRTLTGSFEDVPNVGTVMYVYISFTDENDSLVGGTVYPTFTDSGGESTDGEYAIGDYDAGEVSEAFVDPDSGSLFFAVSGLDETDSWSVDAYVKDSEGRRSNSVSGTVDPY